MAKWVAPLAIVGALLLAILGTTSSVPVGRDAAADVFSAARAMDDVRIIARAPHVTGSAENAEVRAHIAARFTALGMEVRTTQGELPDRALDKFEAWSGARPVALTFTNVIGILPGRDRTKPAVLLMAHHDTVWGSAGAPDDTAGVAAILETLRAVVADGGADRDIIALMTDAEELGLNGATQFFAENPLRKRVGAIINLEARGGGGRTMLFQTSRNNGAAVMRYADAVGRPGGSSLAAFVYEVLPNDTDLTPALEGDAVAYNLSFIGRPEQYHSPAATPDALDEGALQDMGDQTLGLTRALAGERPLPARDMANRTFFDLFGVTIIHYGTVVGWILLGITALLHWLAWRRDAAAGGIMPSLKASAGVVLGGGAALYALNLLSGAGAANSYYDRLAATDMLEAQALLICIAALAATAPWWAGRSGSIVGIGIAFALQVLAPTTAFIAVWPLLLIRLTGLAASRTHGAVAGGVTVAGAALAGGFLLQFGHQLMQGVGQSLPSALALLAALAIPLCGLLFGAVRPATAYRTAVICLAAAIVIALFVRFDPVADTVPDYTSLKG